MHTIHEVIHLHKYIYNTYVTKDFMIGKYVSANQHSNTES